MHPFLSSAEPWRLTHWGILLFGQRPVLTALVVDDNPAIRTVIARSLERRGWEVKTAADGHEGVAAVQAQSFDVVISGVNMPRRGGLWFWEQAVALRSELRGRFVFISGEPLPESWNMGPLAESEMFLLKPLSLASLRDTVQRVVANTYGTGLPSELDQDLSANAFEEQSIAPPQWPPEVTPDEP